MSRLRERVSALWAEWAPARQGRRRFSVGRLVIMTRGELHETAWRHMETGARLEREHPGAVEETERRLREERLAQVRHLRAV